MEEAAFGVSANCITRQQNFGLKPGGFATKVKQINSQSNLICMSSFAGPGYLTIRSSVYIVLIWDPYIFNLYNLWQTWYRCNYYMRRKPDQYALYFSEQITRTHFFSYSLLLGQYQLKLFYCRKAAKTFHRMSPCIPVSVPAKITWKEHGKKFQFRLHKSLSGIVYCPVTLSLMCGWPCFCVVFFTDHSYYQI